MNKLELTASTLMNIENQLSTLEKVILNLELINTQHLPPHTKKALNSIANHLVVAKDEIRKSVYQLEQDNQTLIQKLLQGANALCEENPDLVKGIVDTPKSTEEQIAEDFVENFLNK